MNAIQKSVGEEPVIECQERTFVSCLIPVALLHSSFLFFTLILLSSLEILPRGYKPFFMLNSAEHKIDSAHF